MVERPEAYPPEEIHVDPNQFALFWTLPDKRALRYTVGIGRAGLSEPGEFEVAARFKRDPVQYARYAKAVPGGMKIPLGARAVLHSTTT